METILTVKDLNIQFTKDGEVTKPIRGVTFHVNKSEILGIVGESGCGKSVTTKAVMGLLPEKSSQITQGEILLGEQRIDQLSDKEMQHIRGNTISMIFQEPMTSLNPVFTIGQQLSEPLKRHQKMPKKERRTTIINALRSVGIPRADEIIDEYPHQLSGGMRQRVMITLALLCNPDILIADEPTTALDVTIQAQILRLLKALRQEREMSIVMITHDLGVVAELCDRVIVMYAGNVVEEALINDLFDEPLHPYTQGLIRSLPNNNERKSRLYSIEGNVPKVTEQMLGCAFANRCEFATEKCVNSAPPTVVNGNHKVRCWLLTEDGVMA